MFIHLTDAGHGEGVAGIGGIQEQVDRLFFVRIDPSADRIELGKVRHGAGAAEGGRLFKEVPCPDGVFRDGDAFIVIVSEFTDGIRMPLGSRLAEPPERFFIVLAYDFTETEQDRVAELGVRQTVFRREAVVGGRADRVRECADAVFPAVCDRVQAFS